MKILTNRSFSEIKVKMSNLACISARCVLLYLIAINIPFSGLYRHADNVAIIL